MDNYSQLSCGSLSVLEALKTNGGKMEKEALRKSADIEQKQFELCLHELEEYGYINIGKLPREIPYRREYLYKLFEQKGITTKVGVELEKILGLKSSNGSGGRKILNGTRDFNSRGDKNDDKYTLTADYFIPLVNLTECHAMEQDYKIHRTCFLDKRRIIELRLI